MAQEIIRLQLQSLPVYEVAGLFFAALAYPDCDEITERKKFQRALIRWCLLIRVNLDPSWGAELQQLKPMYFSDQERVFESTLKRGMRKLAHRFVSAIWIALPRILKLERVNQFRPTIENMSTIAMPELGMRGNTSSTFKTKIWKPSRPVVHAASAFVALSRYLLGEDDWSGLDRVMIYWFMTHEDHFKELIHEAEILRKDVPTMERIAIPEAETVQFIEI